jgi:hypothetical protein
VRTPIHLPADVAAVPELRFAVEGAEALPGPAPTVALRLAIERTAGAAVRSMTLVVRVDIATARRRYGSFEEARLVELFGAPDQWGSTLRALPWTRTTVLVGPFDQRANVEVALPCTYDFDVAAAKYLDGLRDGDVPLDLLFTGTVLYQDGGRIQAAPVPWDREAAYRLPVAVWRAAMDAAFPDAAWLRLRRDVFDRLYAFRAVGALPSWEATIRTLLDRAGHESEGPWTR